MAEQLLTLDQVAEYLNVNKFTIYRFLAQKQLPAFKVGNQWRFKRKMIEAWLRRTSNIQKKRLHWDKRFAQRRTQLKRRLIASCDEIVL